MDDPSLAKTLAGRVYENIREDIISGKLAPGSKLRMELLSSQYEVGLTPLREALSRLVGDALVFSEGQRGFWVATLSMEELDDVTSVRFLIESEALARSIRDGDESWEKNLHAAFERLTEAESNLQKKQGKEQLREWELANTAFHESLVSACGSPWLIQLRWKMYRQAERYRRISLINKKGFISR